MIECKKCGKMMVDYATYCPNCGAYAKEPEVSEQLESNSINTDLQEDVTELSQNQMYSEVPSIREENAYPMESVQEQENKLSSLGIVSFALSVIGIQIPALICGIIDLCKKGRKHGFARAGVIISSCSIVISLFLLAVYLTLIINDPNNSIRQTSELTNFTCQETPLTVLGLSGNDTVAGEIKLTEISITKDSFVTFGNQFDIKISVKGEIEDSVLSDEINRYIVYYVILEDKEIKTYGSIDMWQVTKDSNIVDGSIIHEYFYGDKEYVIYFYTPEDYGYGGFFTDDADATYAENYSLVD